ncbi:retrovirus-related pol polyprotein from transposon TNT 1-94, partial [Tanacetum coccineum]
GIDSLSKSISLTSNIDLVSPSPTAILAYLKSITALAVDKNPLPISKGQVGIAEDVLIDVVGYVYPVDFVILDIEEDENKPFILGTPFLTTAKAEIRFDKGIITVKSGKNKIKKIKIPEFPCKVEKKIKEDIDPLTSTNIVSMRILEWEERIKYHQEKEMGFNQLRSKVFGDMCLASENEGYSVNDEKGVT